MNFAFWCVLAAAVLPYLTTMLAKSGGFDNHSPRETLAGLTGWRQRADWAQRNHFEAFPPFAAAVIIAVLTHAPQGRVDLLAGAFIALRVVYTGVYLADWASIRSIIWFAGLGCVVALFAAGA